MTTPQILVTRTGERAGFVVAVLPRTDPYVSGERLIVGDVLRTSRDGEAEKWRAWLWPSAGGALHVTQACEAVDAAVPERLRDRLQKRADKDGAWWGGEDG